MKKPSNANPARTRKPYQKPVLEAITLRAKEDVLAACRTNSAASPGINTCRAPLTACFN